MDLEYEIGVAIKVLNDAVVYYGPVRTSVTLVSLVIENQKREGSGWSASALLGAVARMEQAIQREYVHELVLAWTSRKADSDETNGH